MAPKAVDLCDPTALLCALIKCETITPSQGTTKTVDAAQLLIADWLDRLGFDVTPHEFGTDPVVPNLHADRPVKGEAMSLCFAGHTDVVAPGQGWAYDPFLGECITVDGDTQIYGRGAQDMKSGLAASIAAVARCLKAQPDLQIRLGFLITGDEEGPAIHGTKPLIQAVHEKGYEYSACLLTEPTSQHALGDTIKIGRRGSLSGTLKVQGQQGHVAYPDKADNPMPRVVALLSALNGLEMDAGTPEFQPSNLEILGIDAPMVAWNVTPSQASVYFNVRYNILHTAESLTEMIKDHLDKTGVSYELTTRSSGDAFLTTEPEFVTALQDAIFSVTGRRPALTTGGGTSDARFIHNYWPVAEFGLVGDRMHQTDEQTSAESVETLTKCIEFWLDRCHQNAKI